MKVFTNIEDVKRQWDAKKNIFLDVKFIECFVNNHPRIEHIFISSNNFHLYSHIFKLRLTQTANYLNRYSIFKPLLSLLSINILYLTNSFITNIPSYQISERININNIIKVIKTKKKFFLIVIPDFLFKNIDGDMKKDFARVEVEEEMILNIKNNWKKIDDYINDLKSKYRKKVYSIIKKSDAITVEKLKHKKAKKYKKEISILFDNIIEKSKFSGPKFNTETLISLLEKKYINIYGYFLNNNLIAFSSEIYNNNTLYSYYVGFNKKSNHKYAIYSRILIETIKNAIFKKAEKIVFGRTANEYKSNFGATPMKSFIFLKTNNMYTNKIFKILFTRLKIQPWIQRSPFKQKN